MPHRYIIRICRAEPASSTSPYSNWSTSLTIWNVSTWRTNSYPFLTKTVWSRLSCCETTTHTSKPIRPILQPTKSRRPRPNYCRWTSEHWSLSRGLALQLTMKMSITQSRRKISQRTRSKNKITRMMGKSKQNQLHKSSLQHNLQRNQAISTVFRVVTLSSSGNCSSKMVLGMCQPTATTGHSIGAAHLTNCKSMTDCSHTKR